MPWNEETGGLRESTALMSEERYGECRETERKEIYRGS